VITDWRAVSAPVIAERYNFEDKNYSKKLAYVVNEVFPKKDKKGGDLK